MLSVLPHWLTRHLDARAQSAWHIRSSLAVLVAACITPGVLLSGYFVISNYRTHKAEAIAEAIATARAATANVDRDLAGIEASLRVLAASTSLAQGNLAGFYAEAQHALPFQNITNYVLLDDRDQQLLNTLKPLGSPLPGSGSPQALRRVLTTRERVLTNLFMGPVAHQPILAMGVPVEPGVHPAHILAAGIFPQRIANVLLSQRLPPTWISVVLDSSGHIVARSHDMARFLGHMGVPELLEQIQAQREGVASFSTLEGIPVITAFTRSQVSDWTVAVGIPQAELEARLWRSMGLLLAISGLLYLIALWLAWRLAMRRVVQPAQHLLRRMQGMAAHADPGPNRNVHASHEFVMLEEGFADMGEALQQRERERQAKLAAEAASRAKTEFISRLSHELRTPLNAVQGFAQALKIDPFEPLSPRQIEMVDKISVSGQHLLDIISDVMDISRIESGTLHIAMGDVDVPTLLRESEAAMAQEAQAAGLSLQVEIPPVTPRIEADAGCLKEVLRHLLSNAIHYNRPAGEVRLRTQVLDHALRFEVVDTGIGMSARQLQRLYQPFNRLGREASGTPGTGMGLVISKRLLVLMGSDLQVESQPNKGSRFWFEVPLAD